jgi:hypothetical protein
MSTIVIEVPVPGEGSVAQAARAARDTAVTAAGNAAQDRIQTGQDRALAEAARDTATGQAAIASAAAAAAWANASTPNTVAAIIAQRPPALVDDFEDRRSPLPANTLTRPLRGRWSFWHSSSGLRLRPGGGAELASTGTDRQYARTGAAFRDYLAVVTIQPTTQSDTGWIVRGSDMENDTNPRLYVRCFGMPDFTPHIKLWFATTGLNEGGTELAAFNNWFVPNAQFDLGVRREGRNVQVFLNGVPIIDHTITEAQDELLGNSFGIHARRGAVTGLTEPGVFRRVAVWPLTSRPADFPTIIAHRGVRNSPFGSTGRDGIEPENCISMVERVPYGCGIEIDSRETSDGVPVLMHDATVDRTTDGTGNVGSLSLAQIQALTVKGIGGRRVATVAELLAALEQRPDVPEIYVQWKTGPHATLLGVLAAAPASVRAKCLYFVSTLAEATTVRGLDANVRIAVGSRTTANESELPALVALGVEVGLTPPTASAAQRLHGPTIAAAGLRWVGSTANLHIHVRSLYALGASAFLADYPEAFSWPS